MPASRRTATAVNALRPLAEYLPARLGVTEQRWYQMGRTGLVLVVRLGRRVMVDPQQIEAWIASGGKSLPGGWRRER